MSSIRLSTLGLPKYLTEKLNSASILNLTDLLSKTPMELVKVLNLPLSKVEFIFSEAFKRSSTVEPINIIELMQKNKYTSLSKCYLDEFDNLVLDNELLKKGIICEVCGPPGVGKTQFLFQICSSYLLAHENLNETIIFIDTENNFNTKRFLEIAQSKYFKNQKNEENLVLMTKRIFILKIFTLNDFEKMIDKIENTILNLKTSFIIIDSLASIVRREFSGNGSEILHERSMFLSRISYRLKVIAELLNVSIVLTNQIITCSFSIEGDGSNTENGSVMPALGNSWAHFINIRIVLQFVDDNQRELLIAKSPISPFRKYLYRIDSYNGLIFEDGYVLYKETNPSYQKIKVKPYANY